jgi:hypothetical protein
MSQQHQDRDPDSYELRVGRHLDDHWAGWFGNLALTRETDGTTTLRGPVADQAALHGLLIKIRDLGMTLISVRAIERTAGQGAAAATSPAAEPAVEEAKARSKPIGHDPGGRPPH